MASISAAALADAPVMTRHANVERPMVQVSFDALQVKIKGSRGKAPEFSARNATASSRLTALRQTAPLPGRKTDSKLRHAMNILLARAAGAERDIKIGSDRARVKILTS